MKKLTALLFVLILALSVFGCVDAPAAPAQEPEAASGTELEDTLVFTARIRRTCLKRSAMRLLKRPA